MRVQSLGADQIREAMTSISDVANKTSDSLQELNTAIDILGGVIGYKKEVTLTSRNGGGRLGVLALVQNRAH
jgi:methyl-accepting chemotaxis protein WspA